MWTVLYSSMAKKRIKKLPQDILEIAYVFIEELKTEGPYRANWKNYGKLDREEYHCHLKKGHPTYVVCWRILNKNSKILEVYYVGSHEKAPY